MRKSATALSIVLLALNACKAMREQSDVKGFNPGRTLNTSDSYLQGVKESHPKVVIIYIANDSYTKTYMHSRKNFQYVVSALESEGQRYHNLAEDAASQDQRAEMQAAGDKLQRYAQRIKEEDRRFYLSVLDDIESLKQAACLNPGYRRNPNSIGGVAIFRNADNEGIYGKDDPSHAHRSSLKWDVCKYKPNTDNQIIERRINNVTYFPEFPLNAQPFASRDNILEALNSVKIEFERNAAPEERFRYILIIKSHGSREKVVVPLLSRDLVAERVSPKEISDAVIKSQGLNDTLSNSKMDNPILSSNKMDNPILSEIPAITQLDQKLTNTGAPGGYNGRIGYKKVDFLNDMASLRGMQFPVTVWYSCQSALEHALEVDQNSWILNDTIKNSSGNKVIVVDGKETYKVHSYSNIRAENSGLLYTTDLRGVRYNEIDFEKLIDPNHKYMYIPDLQDAVQALMDDLQAKSIN